MWGEEMIRLEGKAAGHEGMLQDPDGSIIIKPTCQKEVDFYERIFQLLPRSSPQEDDEEQEGQHPEYLGYIVPRFLGTLKQQQQQSESKSPNADSGEILLDSRPADSLDVDKNDDTSQSSETLLVLENCMHGFIKPAVMDVKLGRRLWDHSASLDKRHRLDTVSTTTTSGSLGLRIAGMRTWEPSPSNPHLFQEVEFSKFFGRQLTSDTIVAQGFARFLRSGNLDSNQRKSILEDFIKTLQIIETTLYHSTAAYSLRLCSSSLLFIFESDTAAYTARTNTILNRDDTHVSQEPGPLDDDDSDSSEQQDTPISTVKLIDFAHATFLDSEQPPSAMSEEDFEILKGETEPDENTLKGLSSLISCLNNQLGYYLFQKNWKPLV